MINTSVQRAIDTSPVIAGQWSALDWTSSVAMYMSPILKYQFEDRPIRGFSTVKGMDLEEFINMAADPVGGWRSHLSGHDLNLAPENAFRNIGVFCDCTAGSFELESLGVGHWELCVLTASFRGNGTENCALANVAVSQSVHINSEFHEKLINGQIDIGDDGIALFLFTDEETSDMVHDMFAEIRALSRL
ncbi:MAG: hypothetical protein CMF22_11800 [Idiomarinaceae bacterium]|nr:hypothetical protein [Idiomarinaceae bacterium]|tara:strand:+ start:40621 stop:41190 length:570 start_codon:yes stop_codon:yes gene_type:complete